MTARNAMYHRTTIERDDSMAPATVRDEWGGDQPASWSSTTSTQTVSCRYWYDDSSTIMDGERRILTTARMLLLPIDTDVTDHDRIGDITDRAGRVLAKGPMRIDSLGTHERDHIVAKLVRIT